MFNSNNIPVTIQKVAGFSSLLGNRELYVLREDKIHPWISGNKFRKLKYNLLKAKQLQYSQLLSFGGAFSNHIAALAAVGKEMGFSTVGVIRGEELEGKVLENPTLSFAKRCGMKLHFVSREEYQNKETPLFIETLHQKFGTFYLLPEGGTNALAIKGCEEILSETTRDFQYICASVGTGGTLAGIINASLAHQKIVGFSALKGIFQKKEIEKYTLKTNFELYDDYCFGGYGKIDEDLIRFINNFKEITEIPLDPVYTGKMMFGILDFIKQEKLKENSRILAIHTGGLQGIAGMNEKLKKKQLPQIEL
ncbi:MAG: pyridoxal-phosphate dependent enzyme [Flavobacteriaceae bacterium]